MRADQNPFRVQKIHRLGYKFSDNQTVGQLVDELVLQLRKKPVHAGIIAPHGHGKSTLLKEIHLQLVDRGYHVAWFSAAKTRRDQDRFKPSSTLFQQLRQHLSARPKLETVTLLDSGECLNRIAWWRVRRILKTSHLLTTLHRMNRLPPLIECEASPEIFLENCRQLLKGSPAELRLSDSQMLSVYQDCRENSRDAFFRLYEICATLQLDERKGHPS